MTPEQAKATVQIGRAAKKATLAQANLRDTMRAASRAGLSLRAIASAADISHEQVRRILAKDQS